MSTTRFSSLLPPETAIVEATDPALWEGGLLPEEAAFIGRAVPKRQREFTAGRNCARLAMQQLGIAPVPPVKVGAQREPLFPPGLSGTITHTHEYCAAAVLRQGEVRSIGIDAEVNGPLGDDIARLVLLPAEQAMAQTLAVPGLCVGKLVFSIKEAFYKAYFQVAGQYLDFLDACVSVAPRDGSFTLQVVRADVPAPFAGSAWRGRYAFDAQRVYSAIAINAAIAAAIEAPLRTPQSPSWPCPG
ncbi:MAG TPA: 4'-phosphopantetheinyl transferase superfamily protein [Burkholderiaceae bacterium]|nr:4'-phosphopantetheinyl transferase superfamily protein [Burkholderiaceae bacterium]